MTRGLLAQRAFLALGVMVSGLACGAGGTDAQSTRIASEHAPSRTRAATVSTAPTQSPSPLELAVTVDDLPIHGPAYAGIDRLAIADRMLAAFRSHHLPPVYGFVNGHHVDERPETKEILRHWLSAGNRLGNHTYSHISLNDAPVDRYIADLEKGEAVLKELVPDERDWHVFRYPYLFEGPDLDKRNRVRSYLFEHHYAIAEVTIDGDDWAWNPPFARCKDKRDTAALQTLHDGYVKTHTDELRFIRHATREMMGRDIRHVLLLHIGAADAEAIDDLLTAFEGEGVRFVDLPTALADPVYREDPAWPTKAGAALPYPLAKAKGVKLGSLPARPQEEALESTCR